MLTWKRRSGIMLAYPFEEKRLAKWPKPYITQPKLDGDRCRAIRTLFNNESRWQLISSEQNSITMLPHITAALEKYLGHINAPTELDGELYIHGVPHELIHGIVSRKVNAHTYASEIEYHIFDIVSTDPQVKRTVQLTHLQSVFPSNCPIKVVTYIPASQIDTIMRIIDLYIKDGYEGIIVRNIDGYYQRRRSVDIMKFKPAKNDAYKIIDTIEEKDQHGTPKGRLGAFVCTSDGQTFNVGTGLSIEQREYYWKIRDSLPDNYIEVKYQHLTAQKGVPRFPVFVELLQTE
jgi:ATP-dependent DNA ligase